MKKKWSKAQYGRERYLATEFLKSKSEQMNEGKLTEFQKIKLPKGKAKVVKTSNGWELLINNGKTTFTLDLGNS